MWCKIDWRLQGGSQVLNIYPKEPMPPSHLLFQQANNRIYHDTYDFRGMEAKPAKDMLGDLIYCHRQLTNNTGCIRVVTLIVGQNRISRIFREMLKRLDMDFRDLSKTDGVIEFRLIPPWMLATS